MSVLPPEIPTGSERLGMRRARPAESELAYWIKRDALVPQQVAVDAWDETEQWQAHERRFATQDYYLFEMDGEAIGVMALVVAPEQIRLNQFFVLRSHQGNGTGTAALRVLVAEAVKRNLPIRLDVMPDNRRAIALYERFGFARIESMADRVAMVRRCGGPEPDSGLR